MNILKIRKKTAGIKETCCTLWMTLDYNEEFCVYSTI